MRKINYDDLPQSITEKIEDARYIQGIRLIRNIGYEFPDISERVERLHKSPPSGYTYKIIDYQSGKKEIILYGKPQAFGFTRKHNPERRENRTMANEENAKRARKKVYQLVEANLTPYTKFVTLTYAENMQDYDKLAKDFKAFVLSLKRKGYKFPYLWVVEAQKRGALHVHALFFTDEYIPHDKLAKAWPHGFVKINAQFQKVDHKAAYVAKYIQKDTLPPDKKAYRTSRNIKRPTETVGLGDFQDALPHANLKEYKRVDKRTYNIPSIHDTVNYQTGEVKPHDLRATVYEYQKGKPHELEKQLMAYATYKGKK